MHDTGGRPILTPLAAAICTITSMAARLKQRPSLPTTMVQPCRSRRSMEDSTLWMQFCKQFFFPSNTAVFLRSPLVPGRWSSKGAVWTVTTGIGLVSILFNQSSKFGGVFCLFCFVLQDFTALSTKISSIETAQRCNLSVQSEVKVVSPPSRKKAVTAVPHRDEMAIVTRNSQSKMFSPRPKPGVASYSTG